MKFIKIGAEWCGQCKVVGKTIEGLKSDYPDIEFVNLDVEEDESLVDSYKVRNIPVCILEDDGKEIARFTGIKNKTDLKNWIDEKVSNN